jgi:hypothetical protein
MPKYSRSHERTESAKISRGLWESLFGLMLSWLPGVGLILSVAGFCRQAVRLTEAHRAKRFFALAFASVVLIVSIGALMGEAYLYSRNPNIVQESGLWLWKKVTGQEMLPGAVDAGYPAEGDYYAGDGQLEEGDLPVGDDQMEEGDLPVGDDQLEEGDLPVGNDQLAEGDFQDNIDFSEDDSDEAGGAGEAPEATLPPLSDLLKSRGVTVG